MQQMVDSQAGQSVVNGLLVRLLSTSGQRNSYLRFAFQSAIYGVFSRPEAWYYFTLTKLLESFRTITEGLP